MTQPIMTDEPEIGSVDYFRSRLALAANVSDLHTLTLGLIDAVFYDASASSAARLQRIDHVLTVSNEVTAALLKRRAADPVGLTYSRVDDDPQVLRPHSPRVPLRIGSVGNEGLVDETPGEPECSPACWDQDGDQPHLADCPARPGSEA